MQHNSAQQNKTKVNKVGKRFVAKENVEQNKVEGMILTASGSSCICLPRTSLMKMPFL